MIGRRKDSDGPSFGLDYQRILLVFAIVHLLVIALLIADKYLRKRTMAGFRTTSLEVWLREQRDRLDQITRLEEEIAARHRKNRVDWKKEGF